MTPHTRLIAALRAQIAAWETLAQEARTRADQSKPGDLPPAYLYGVADQAERTAEELRKVIEAARRGK